MLVDTIALSLITILDKPAIIYVSDPSCISTDPCSSWLYQSTNSSLHLDLENRVGHFKMSYYGPLTPLLSRTVKTNYRTVTKKANTRKRPTRTRLVYITFT